MDKFLVKDWMTEDPIMVDTTNNLSTAYHLMRMNSVRRLPVVDEADRLVGIVTWGDIREARPKANASMGIEPTWEIHFLAGIRGVQEFMTPNPVTVTPQTPIRRAAELMLENKIGGLPVVEHDHVVGMISETDIFRFLLMYLEEPVLELAL
ncbi:MAG: CBS domain-containing protein [Caldilineaceae bacterium]